MSSIYRTFVAVMVFSLLGVFYHMDKRYKTSSDAVALAEDPELVTSEENETEQGAPSESVDPIRSSQFALQMLDKLDEATVIDSLESIDDNGAWVKKEILLTNMKYPLIRREIKYQQDKSSGKWVPVEGHAYVANQVLLGLEEGEGLDALDGILDHIDAEVVHSFRGGSQFLLKFEHRDVESVEEVVQELKLYGHIDYAEPNYIRQPTYIPNDSRFDEMWALNNDGFNGSRVDADIDAVEAWDITRGNPSVIVAVVDTGIDIHHPDLSASIYVNPNEILNGVDDDNNGYVDDINGWNFAGEDSGNHDVSDTVDSHGSHVSGTIAARGDNNQGVIGVAPFVSLLPVKVLDDEGGFLSDYISGLDYATEMGASVINVSLGGTDESNAERRAIERAERANVLIVVASGNDSLNLEKFEDYPTCYTNDNIIATLATDDSDNFADYSNFGSTTVDVAAPGTFILSTFKGGDYLFFTGTSMAAPHLSGVAALIKSVNPAATHLEIKQAIMKTVDQHPSLIGKCVTGGRINAHKAINEALRFSFFPHGSQIAIKSNVNNRFVRPDPGNEFRLIADGSQINQETIFFSYEVNSSRYALKSMSNRLFVGSTPTAEDALKANKSNLTYWELFSPRKNAQGLYTIQAMANNGYVSAGLGGSQPLISNRKFAKEQELFSIVPVLPLPPGERVMLQSIVDGKYVATNPDRVLITQAAANDKNSKFDVELTVDGYIALKAVSNNKYVSVAPNSLLSANKTTIGDTEKFIGIYHDSGQMRLLSKSTQLLLSTSNGASSALIANKNGLTPTEVYFIHLVD